MLKYHCVLYHVCKNKSGSHPKGANNKIYIDTITYNSNNNKYKTDVTLKDEVEFSGFTYQENFTVLPVARLILTIDN